MFRTRRIRLYRENSTFDIGAVLDSLDHRVLHSQHHPPSADQSET
jgi:hypothetical protein